MDNDIVLNTLRHERDELKAEVQDLKDRLRRQADWIRFLSERQWNTVWMKPFFRVIYSPFYLVDWISRRRTERNTAEHRRQDNDQQDQR